MNQLELKEHINKAEFDLSQGQVEKAIDQFIRLSQNNIKEAYDWLALIYSDASYDMLDYGKSIKWCKISIERFDSDIAKLVLASMYYYGDGVDIDYKKSLDLYLRIPNGMFSQREYLLAIMYISGVPIAIDLSKATHHAKESYKLGNIGARQLLSQIYFKKYNFF